MASSAIVVWAGFALGLVFGGISQLSGFCLHRGLQELWLRRRGVKLRSFALALAVAILGTQALAWSGQIELDRTFYAAPVFSWLLVPVGGVLFGVGMTLANGCGARSLVLLGQGNLRSLVVLGCLAVAGYATLTGVLAPGRQWLAELTPLAPGVWGRAYALPYQAVAAVGWLALLAYALSGGALWQHRRDLLSGLVVGGLVVAGWVATGIVGADPFDPEPLASLTFVAPLGAALQYLMIATGMSLEFGAVVVFGTVVGAAITAVATGSFQWQGYESAAQMRRYITGGLAMGVGGALAMGCSVGQGLTGMSTLALSSLLALAGIILGSRLASRGQASA